MTKTWRTKDGKDIPYKDLELSHLAYIINFIEERAERGVILYFGGGFSPEDMWYDEEMIYGEEVKNYYDYQGLLKELESRSN